MQYCKTLLLTLPVDFLESVTEIAAKQGLSQGEKLREWIYLGAEQEDPDLGKRFRTLLSERHLREEILKIAGITPRCGDSSLYLESVMEEASQDPHLLSLYHEAIQGVGPDGKGPGKRNRVQRRLIRALARTSCLPEDEEVLQVRSRRAMRILQVAERNWRNARNTRQRKIVAKSKDVSPRSGEGMEGEERN